MQTALALDAPALDQIIFDAARELARRLGAGETISRRDLSEIMGAVSGGTDAQGYWSRRDAYDAIELAQVLLVDDRSTLLSDLTATAVAAWAEEIASRLPVQGVRAEAQIDLQQFATPLPLAVLAARATQLSPLDLLLEPSAGTGMLAAWGKRAGCSLLLNEIDAGRALLLLRAFPAARISQFDGELIDDRLDPRLAPTSVLMNPPFSRAEGRGDDRHACVRHLRSAMRRLANGGRLVAIMPEWFSEGGTLGVGYCEIARHVTLRLDARLHDGTFARHGTSVGVRLVVYDKCGTDLPPPLAVKADWEALAALVEALPPREDLARSAPVAGLPGQTAPAPSLFAKRAGDLLRPTPAPNVPSTAAPAPVSFMALDDPAPIGRQVGIYLPYRPSRLIFDGATAHPTPLVESLAMASIAAPKPSYAPLLPEALVRGGLSDAQLESLVYAGAAFERDLPGRCVARDEGCSLVPSDADEATAYRTGYFLGDGTGAGKGRQVAGIILDQWLRGRRRHIWLSKNETLLEDARRDWSALGGLPLDIQPLSQWKLGDRVGMGDGILFVTYPTLRSGRAETTRLAQLVDWTEAEFDGVIAFDEAHAMANAAGGEGSRGAVKGSEQGIAGLRLQNLLPRARVLYVSATGASDVNNLAYASRLGLWGPSTAFANRDKFVADIRAGGIAAMELVARDLKAQGLYTARALSFDGVEYDVLEHPLTPAQIRIYDAYAEAWAIIHRNLHDALEATRVVDGESGGTLNKNAKSAALSVFEGTKQRFFGQLLLSMKLPALLPSIEADLAADHAVVVQLVSTAEAMLDRRLADLSPSAREALEIDLSPREYVVDYLQSAFPVRLMSVFTDSEGNLRSEPMTDDAGRPVLCRAALAARDRLIEQLCALPAIGTALDTLIERFGTEAVAEVTGRTRRLVVGSDGRQRLENRSPRAKLVETDAFMRGAKRILIFSDAGGTGCSYHASLDVQNQRRRIHYLLEPGWRADAAIQGLGRTHRTRQASAPLFRPVTTDCRGERRFISTIARRLDSLGALTRGQRQTGGQNLFNPADNLESDYAKDALRTWFRLLFDGKLKSTTLADFVDRSGLRLIDASGGLVDELPPIQRWLNRILALPIALQNAIFDEFTGLIEARVDAAREAGRLDVGVETIVAESFSVTEDRVIRTDAESGATTHLVRVELRRRVHPLTFERLDALYGERQDAMPMINTRSGKSALRIDGRGLTTDEGEAIARYELVRPARREHLVRSTLAETSWERADWSDFAAAWRLEAAEIAATLHTETRHFVTGLLLPVWNLLPSDHVQVSRLVADDGQSLLGREVPLASIPELSEKLGIEVRVRLSSSEVGEAVMRAGKPLPFRGVDALTVKRSLVNGLQRLELVGFEPARLDWYKAAGCFTEIIQYRTRLFVPVDLATAVLDRLRAHA